MRWKWGTGGERGCEEGLKQKKERDSEQRDRLRQCIEAPNCTSPGFIASLREVMRRNTLLIVGTATVSGVALGLEYVEPQLSFEVYQDPDDSTDFDLPEMVKGAFVQEREARGSEIETIERIDKLHREVGKKIKENPFLVKDFSPEQLQAVEEAFEEFNPKRAVEIMSRESGISSWKIAKSWKASRLVIYSDALLAGDEDDELEGVSKDILSKIGGMAPTSGRLTRIDVKAFGSKMPLGTYDLRETTIFINLSDILRSTNGDPARLKEAVLDVLYHENLHSIGKGKNYGTYGDLSRHPGDIFYEGETEVLANLLVHEIHPNVHDPYTGYANGGLAGAAFVYTMLSLDGRQAFWRGYLESHPERLIHAYDAQFGEGHFAKLIQPFAQNISEKQPFNNLLVLDRAMSDAGDNAQSLADEANRILGSGLIVPLATEDVRGVILSTKNSVGISGGILHIEDVDGRAVIGLRPASEDVPDSQIDTIPGSLPGTLVWTVRLPESTRHLSDVERFSDFLKVNRAYIDHVIKLDREYKQNP